MILLTIVAVGLLTLSSVSLRASSQGQAMAFAQANARMALALALGELQKSTGPDQRITAAADILPASARLCPCRPRPRSLDGCLDTSAFSPAKPDTKAFVRWLVSDTPSSLAQDCRSGVTGLNDPLDVFPPATYRFVNFSAVEMQLKFGGEINKLPAGEMTVIKCPFR